MSDSGKGVGGVLFEAGQSAVKATGNQAKQAAQTLFQDAQAQITGKPVKASPAFKQTTGSFPPPGALGELSDFEKKMLGKASFGAQSQAAQEAAQRQQLKSMSEQNETQDRQRIAELTKQLHDEVYYNRIKNSSGSLASQRKEKEQREQAEEQAQEEKKRAQEASLQELQVPQGKMKGFLGSLMKKKTNPSLRSSTHETPKASG